MTMVNTTVSSTPRSGVSSRKTNKPLMEKRRRARINDSLTQLKSLVIQGSKKDSSQFSKLEKADILELTVKHLRGLQVQQQQQMSQSCNVDATTPAKYRAGFVECANEVMRYLEQSQQGFNDDTKMRVITHLAGCLQLMTQVHPKQVQQQQPVQVSQQPPLTAIPNGATIIGAPTTTTTQLPNGQIIQIVGGAVHNFQQASAVSSSTDSTNAGQTAARIPSTQSTPVSTEGPSQHATSSFPTANEHQQQQQQSSYVRYTQPLHIQIPPLVSPVLVKTQKVQKAPEPVQHCMPRTSEAPKPLHAQKSIMSSNDFVHSSSSASPSPQSVSSPNGCSSPAYRIHAKNPAQKQLNFYSQEEFNSELLSRSRSYSMTSSSSESEMTSPLNLSRSPPFSRHSGESTTEINNNHIASTKQFQQMSKNHIHDTHQQMIFPSKFQERTYSNTYANRDSRYNERISPQQHNEYMIKDRLPSFNTTSVIVNSKKFADIPDSKYLSMMMEVEDDRHCIRHNGTPSPSSSVGEERLWRPW